MNYKQIETSREIRLWIGQVIVPGAIACAAVFSNPDVRRWTKEKAQDLKFAINRRISKL